MWLTNIIYSEREIGSERLELREKDGLYYLGPKLTLRKCTLILRVPAKRLVVSHAQFIDCAIEVKQELKNFSWDSAYLKGCRFRGRLTGCDFGRWPDKQEGGIEDCDFSAARLHGCRFIGCDISTLKLPPWPCFTILDPARRVQELMALPWPGTIPAVVKGFDWSPPTTVAETYHAPSWAKENDTTEEAIKAVLERLAGVIY